MAFQAPKAGPQSLPCIVSIAGFVVRRSVQRTHSGEVSSILTDKELIHYSSAAGWICFPLAIADGGSINR